MLESEMRRYCYKAECCAVEWDTEYGRGSDHWSYVTAAAEREALRLKWLRNIDLCPVMTVRKNGVRTEKSTLQQTSKCFGIWLCFHTEYYIFCQLWILLNSTMATVCYPLQGLNPIRSLCMLYPSLYPCFLSHYTFDCQIKVKNAGK